MTFIWCPDGAPMDFLWCPDGFMWCPDVGLMNYMCFQFNNTFQRESQFKSE